MNDPDQFVRAMFDPNEIRAFQALHARYQQDHDTFSEAERARLQFMRWLYESGRIQPRPRIEGRSEDDDDRDHSGTESEQP